MAKRLFAWTPSGDDQWCLCGGPDLDDALAGLMNVIRHDVGEILNGNTSELSIEFAVREMSDEKCGMCESEIEVGHGVKCANCVLCDGCGQYAADFACGPAE